MGKNARISQLEASVRNLTTEKDSLFDQLQMRQAELESSQYQLEALTNENKDLSFRLREASDRVSQLSDEISDVHARPSVDYMNGALRSSANASPIRSHPHTPTPGPTPIELARLLSETEGKYETKLSELRGRLRALEKERMEAEEEWGRNFNERGKELEKLRKTLNENEARAKTKSTQNSTGGRVDGRESDKEKEMRWTKVVDRMKIERAELNEEMEVLKKEAERLRDAEVSGWCGDFWLMTDAISQTSLREDKTDTHNRLVSLEKQLDEIRGREAQLKNNNKVSTSPVPSALP